MNTQSDSYILNTSILGGVLVILVAMLVVAGVSLFADLSEQVCYKTVPVIVLDDEYAQDIKKDAKMLLKIKESCQNIHRYPTNIQYMQRRSSSPL